MNSPAQVYNLICIKMDSAGHFFSTSYTSENNILILWRLLHAVHPILQVSQTENSALAAKETFVFVQMCWMLQLTFISEFKSLDPVLKLRQKHESKSWRYNKWLTLCVNVFILLNKNDEYKKEH